MSKISVSCYDPEIVSTLEWDQMDKLQLSTELVKMIVVYSDEAKQYRLISTRGKNGIQLVPKDKRWTEYISIKNVTGVD